MSQDDVLAVECERIPLDADDACIAAAIGECFATSKAIYLRVHPDSSNVGLELWGKRCSPEAEAAMTIVCNADCPEGVVSISGQRMDTDRDYPCKVQRLAPSADTLPNS